MEQKSRNQLVKDFNTIIFKMLNLIKDKDPISRVDRIITLIKTAKRIDHEFIIVSFGPILYNEKNSILSRELEQKITKEYLSNLVVTSSGNPETLEKKIIFDMFESVTKIIRSMTQNEKNAIYDQIDQMLGLYIRFCLRSKVEAKS